jgi:hypothetical protein
MFARLLILAALTASLMAPGDRPGLVGAAAAASFSGKVDNPWYPLIPGTVLTYTGQADRKAANRVVTVTGRTVSIRGVKCIVVEDELSFSGELAEKNLGYYAQDDAGNVWNFGEDAQEFENGQLVVNEGWRAGVNGAEPSLVMEGAPAVGHSFAHAYSKDHFAVVSLAEPLRVPYGSFTDALVTKEWNPLERDVLTQKYYLRGIGEARDVVVRGPKEEFQLVSVKKR